MALIPRTLLLTGLLVSVSAGLMAEPDALGTVRHLLEYDYYALESRGESEKAHETLLQAHSQLTRSALTDPREWQMLGRIEHLLGNHHAAAIAYQRASQLAPQSLDLYMLTAVAYSRTGDLDAALEQLLIAKSLSPDSQTAMRIDLYIERLQRAIND